MVVTLVAEAREAYARRDWRAVYDGLQPLRDSLGTDDLAALERGDLVARRHADLDGGGRGRLPAAARRGLGRAGRRLRAPALPGLGDAR